ncbi:MAG: flagellin [Halapricum sp.]
MGFSVSGSAAIIFAGMFIAFGMFYSATSNSMEQVTDAQGDWQDHSLAQQNTAVNVTGASYNASTNSLVVTVANTGATSLSVNGTDLLVDNTYETSFVDRSVDGDTSTDLWLPGEQLRYNVSFASQPSRVKVVTGPGVAATEVVTNG